MSDLQDLIATNAVRAYNQGVERGAAEERDRIIKLLEPYIDCRDELCYPYCSCFRSEFAIALIKGEQK